MKFSVIIPVYNKADTIAKSIDSVIAQDYKDFEIVVVNDGSTDNIRDVLSYYPNIKVINQPNGGVSVARNTGISHSVGDYICFLDADDLYMPEHLSTLHFLITKYPKCSYFCTSHLIKDGHKEIDTSLKLSDIKEDEIVSKNLFELLNKYTNSIIHTNSICIKRKLFYEENIFFAEGEKLGEDIDVWYRVALHNEITISKKVTTIYQQDFSTATLGGFNPNGWIFIRRNKDILFSNVAIDVKREALKLIDRNYLRCARYNKLNSKVSLSFDNLMNVNNKLTLHYLYSLLFCLLPQCISRKLKQ